MPEQTPAYIPQLHRGIHWKFDLKVNGQKMDFDEVIEEERHPFNWDSVVYSWQCRYCGQRFATGEHLSRFDHKKPSPISEDGKTFQKSIRFHLEQHIKAPNNPASV